MVGLTGRKHAPLEAGKTKDKRQKLRNGVTKSRKTGIKDKRQKAKEFNSSIFSKSLLSFNFYLLSCNIFV